MAFQKERRVLQAKLVVPFVLPGRPHLGFDLIAVGRWRPLTKVFPGTILQ